MNQVILIGRNVKAIELRYIPQSETAVASFFIAVDRQTKEKKTDFFNITAFGKTAELCERFLGKGKLVAVKGRIENDTYEKNGEKKFITKIIAEQVQFLEWKDEKEESHSQIPKEEKYEGFQPVSVNFQALGDDDIPF